MSISALNSSMEAQANLVETVVGGQLQQVDQAMKTAKVGMQMGMKMNEMAQAQEIVAQMTGVGQNLNVTA